MPLINPDEKGELREAINFIFAAKLESLSNQKPSNLRYWTLIVFLAVWFGILSSLNLREVLN